jgi:hypothetical protein
LASAAATDNIVGEASVADPLLWNFSAAVGSPLRGEGLPLARAVGSGTGTVIQVDDALAFYPGMVIAGIVDQGDLLSIGSAGQVARVLSRDIEKSEVALDRAVDWKDGDPIDLVWSGGGRDIGLIEAGTGARASVHVTASARWVAPGTTVRLGLSAWGCVPRSAEWWLGDTIKKTGLSVAHQFSEEDDHPIRVRVACEDGRHVWAVYLITCRAVPNAADPLLQFSFDDATDPQWWWQWKTYAPAPAQPAKSVLDHDLQRNVLEVVAPEAPGPRMPCALYPEHWDTALYPMLYVKYKCAADVPLTVKLIRW